MSLTEEKTIKSYLEVLSQRHLAMLWLSQVLSAIGDQLHSLAVIWISVQIGGAKAGFVAAAGTIAGVLVGLFAGVYADRWNRRLAMIVVDVLRAIAVLGLAIIAQTGTLQLWQLGVVAIVVSSLGSLFSPCMSASLPALVPQPEMLRAITALMIMDLRIARLVGPGIAGIVLAYLPISAFFAFDALTYVVSALAIWSLGTKYAWRPEKVLNTKGLRGILLDLQISANLARSSRQMTLGLTLGLMEAGLWCTAYLVGFPLMIKHNVFGNGTSSVTAYSAVICAYGFGNVVSLIFAGTRELHNRAVLFSGIGLTLMGVGFIIFGISHSLLYACLAAALAATGGPINDMAMMTLLQQFPDEHRGKLNSLRSFVGGLGAAVGLSAAPLFFSTIGTTFGVSICGGGIFTLGLIGIIFGPAADRHSLIASRSADPDLSVEVTQFGRLNS